MQINFEDFEPGKPMIIENYGKRLTITVEDLATEDRVQEAIESAYGPFTHSFVFKPASAATFAKIKEELTPVEPKVEYVYWCTADDEEETVPVSTLEFALNYARDDFTNWADRPLEIRVNGEVK